MSRAPGAPVVVVAGHVTLDRYGGALLPGGSAFYAARAYAGLGARVRVVTAAADDFPRDVLGSAEVTWIPSEGTSRWSNEYASAGVRRQRVEATATSLDPARLPREWQQPALLHLAPILSELDPATWTRAAHARFVGLGVQGCVRALAPDGTVRQPRWEWAPGALDGIDAVSLGEDDVDGQGDLLDRLIATVPIVAFTRGARGCDLFVRGTAEHVRAFPTREVDPTGAGDVFAAGFFLELARGTEPFRAARLGAAAASIVVEGRAGETLGRIREAWARLDAVGAG